MPTKTVEMALQEAALGLAWHMRTYGGVPSADVTKLQAYAPVCDATLSLANC
jgi:hypothetical protein